MNKREQLEADFLTFIRRGMSLHEASAALGIHRSTGQRWLKRIGDAETQPKRPKRQRRPWWESDNPRQAGILRQIRDRLGTLYPAWPLDDPRLLFKVHTTDDVALIGLRDQLAAAGLYV